MTTRRPPRLWSPHRSDGVIAAIALLSVGTLLAALFGHQRAAPSPPPADNTSAVRARLGFYPGTGDGPQALEKFRGLERALGRGVHYAVVFGDTRGVSEYKSSIFGEFVQHGGWRDAGADRPTIVLSVPLAFGPQNPSRADGAAMLQRTAAGAWDEGYAYSARSLVEAGYSDAVIRLGWEYDGSWMPWSARNDPAGFVAAYRRVRAIFAAASSSFRFDLCGSAGFESTWTRAYPGDDAVDIIGLDLYDTATGAPAPAEALPPTGITSSAQGVVGLQSHTGFARAHGKLVSYPEWGLWNGGVGRGDDAAFVRQMFTSMAALPATGPGSLAYHAYFNGDPGGANGEHELRHFPVAERVFVELFGAAHDPPSPTLARLGFVTLRGPHGTRGT